MTLPARPTTRLAVVLLLVLPLAGCDLFGPSGPGALEATVTVDEPLGALVLELDGGGVTGFQGRGDTRVVGSSRVGSQGRRRVVLVTPDGSPIRFAIEVDDLGADPPSVRVVSAVDLQNRPSNALGIEVRVD